MSDPRPQSVFWGPFSGLGAITVALTFVIDQLHKWWMILGYQIESKGRVALTPFLDLVFVKNKGVSYGLLAQDGHGGQWLLALFAVLTSAFLWIWLAKTGTNRLIAVSLGFIMGGALGNALDRVLLGGVADFFSLHAFGFYWYVFNIADIAIVAGVVGLLYESLVTGRTDASNST